MTEAAIRVVDLETLGLEADCGVCEIGIIDVFRSGVGVGCAELVNPGKPIPPEASAIHHIIDADVARASSWAETSARLLAGDHVVAFSAHNSRFEQKFITSEMTGGKPWICTYKCALRVWPEAPDHKNQTLRYWLKLPVDRVECRDVHRALPDAIVTAHLLVELLKKATIKQLSEWSRSPALLVKVGFGMHFGKKWTEVPRDYLDWCLKQDMDEDVMFTARQVRDGKAS